MMESNATMANLWDIESRRFQGNVSPEDPREREDSAGVHMKRLAPWDSDGRCSQSCVLMRICRWLLLGMTGDDLIFDLVVDALGENAARDELVFSRVGAAIDDALGVGIADAADGFELVGCRSVDIERRCAGFRCGRRWFGRLSWSKG